MGSNLEGVISPESVAAERPGSGKVPTSKCYTPKE